MTARPDPGAAPFATKGLELSGNPQGLTPPGTSVNPNRDLWWTVALEAALFFSIPAWQYTDREWPPNHPAQFALALFIGATAALLLCHVLPARCGAALSDAADTRLGRLLRWPIGIWLCVGAAAWLGHLLATMARFLSVDLATTDPNQLASRSIAAGVGILCVTAAVARTWQRALTALALGAGVSMLLASVWVLAPGTDIRNDHLITEAGLGDPLAVAKGMLIAASPAIILALRIGKMPLSLRQIWLSGLAGIWLPAITSVTLMSFAKIWGARFFWRPSGPIEYYNAFVWMLDQTRFSYKGIWPLSLALLAPCLIYAIWLSDLTRHWPWGWRKLLALLALAAAAWATMQEAVWTIVGQPWLWSILAVGVTAATAQLFLHPRRASPQQHRPTIPNPTEM